MKVYGGEFFLRNPHKQVRGIMAGTQRQVAEAIGGSVGYVRAYWTQTGNEIEVAAATGKPGVLLWADLDSYPKSVKDYKEVKD